MGESGEESKRKKVVTGREDLWEGVGMNEKTALEKRGPKRGAHAEVTGESLHRRELAHRAKAREYRGRAGLSTREQACAQMHEDCAAILKAEVAELRGQR